MVKADPKKILFYIWMGFSTLSTAVSLASLFDGVVAWAGFIKSLIEAYRQLVDGFWGTLFAFFHMDVAQYVHDYFTINSLFAISITWGFYRTGDELGFGLASIRQFLKNNLLDFTLGGNTFQLFQSGVTKKVEEECGDISDEAEQAIEFVTRDYPKSRLIIDGLISSALLLLLVVICSFLIPLFLKWRDMRWNAKSRVLLLDRERELDSIDLDGCEKPIFKERFNSLCVFSTESERQILELYHRIFRRSIGWYLLAVSVLFLLLVIANYVVNRI